MFNVPFIAVHRGIKVAQDSFCGILQSYGSKKAVDWSFNSLFHAKNMGRFMVAKILQAVCTEMKNKMNNLLYARVYINCYTLIIHVILILIF